MNGRVNYSSPVYMPTSRMENQEKPATLGTQDEDKTKTQYVLDTAIPKQTQIA